MPHPAFLGPVSGALLELASAFSRMNAPVAVTTGLTRMSWLVADMGS